VNADDAVRGTLAEGALASLLGGLQRARATGWLRVNRMAVRAGIPSVSRLGWRLHEGRVVGMDGDTTDQFGASLPLLDLAERATAGLCRMLASRDAVQSWEPEAAPGASEPSAPWLATLALRAVERLDEAAVSDALSDLDRQPRRASCGEAELSLLPSGPRDLLPRLRPEITGAELIRSGGESTARDLLALVCAGVVEWAAPAPASPPVPDVRPMAAKPAPAKASPPPAVRATAPPPTPPPPSAPGPDATAMRLEVEAAYAALRGASHFALLGLTPQATLDDVRRAFARVARRYHPDAQRDPSLHDLRAKINDVFVAVGNAYAVLKDPTARTRYESNLPVPLPHARAARPAPETSFSPAPDVPAASHPLEARLLGAQEALDAREPWEAIRLLEEVVPAAAGPLKLRAQVLLGRAYIERERPREAEKVLLEALQEDSRCLPACLLLGRLYRQRGMVKRSKGWFERALEIQPGQAEARIGLAALDDPPLEPGAPSLLSRLRERS
jgi:tetratricopeptide (TPR) repeat protein